MKVLFNNFKNKQTQNFSARNKEIRTADDILRKANNNFNFISSSRIDDYFELNDDYKRRQKAEDVSKKLRNTILAARYMANMLNETGQGIGVLYADDLDLSSHMGLGNCMEYAKAGIAALCANGYYNNERINLRYQVSFQNKKTGEIEYKNLASLDHSFAVTDLNSRDEKDIVVDPWFNFADYKENALTKFNVAFEDDIKTIEEYSKKMFMLQKLLEDEDFNLEDYKMSGEFIFATREEDAEKCDMERLGEYAREVYPKLVLN